nr:MAG TPA: hypothetical protein [Caudoviricetes sp.]
MTAITPFFMSFHDNRFIVVYRLSNNFSSSSLIAKFTV